MRVANEHLSEFPVACNNRPKNSVLEMTKLASVSSPSHGSACLRPGAMAWGSWRFGNLLVPRETNEDQERGEIVWREWRV